MNKSQNSRPRTASGASSASGKARTGGGRRARRAAETRVRLFRSALELIAERGLPNVTVEDITEAADVGKGTFFNYFASKEHVLGVMAEIQLSKVKQAAERPWTASASHSPGAAPAHAAAGGRARTKPQAGAGAYLLFSGQ